MHSTSHIGIVGFGSIGKRHLRIVKKYFPEIEVTLIRRKSHSYNSDQLCADNVVYSLDKAVDLGIQAAIIASPATLHIDQSVQLAKSGIHLLVEKPLSVDLSQTDSLLEVVSMNQLTVLIGYVLRFEPSAGIFKKMLKDDSIGKILHVRVECSSYLPDWRPGQDYRDTVSAREELGGGVLNELSHEFDYISWLFGKPLTVYAKLHNSGILNVKVEESATLIITTDQHFPISVHLSFNSFHSARKCVVETTKGKITWDLLEQTIISRLDSESAPPQKCKTDRDNLFRLQFLHFLECIENGINPSVSINDAVETVKLILASKESHRTGKQVII